MSELQTSLFRPFSIGIVAVNKEISSREILAAPIEVLTHLDGDLTSNPEELSTEGVDDLDITYTTKVNMDNALKAEWLGQSNRMTPPDVRRGERVLLWQYSDSDKFYWTSLGMDDNLRKLETILFSVSGTTDEEETELTADNTYWLEVSTHTKTVTLQTSAMNGEPFRYTFQFNTGDGIVTLADDDGNYFELDSTETKLTLWNARDTWISLDKNDIIGNAVDDFRFTVGRDFNFTVGNNVTFNVGGSWDTAVKGSTSWKTGGFKCDTPVFEISGELKVGGAGSFGGAVDSAGYSAPGGYWHGH